MDLERDPHVRVNQADVPIRPAIVVVLERIDGDRRVGIDAQRLAASRTALGGGERVPARPQ
jgi:hypothetical protein